MQDSIEVTIILQHIARGFRAWILVTQKNFPTVFNTKASPEDLIQSSHQKFRVKPTRSNRAGFE